MRRSQTTFSVLACAALGLVQAGVEGVAAAPASPSSEVVLRRFLPDRSVTRVGRAVVVEAVIVNGGDESVALDLVVTATDGLRLSDGSERQAATLEPGDLAKWTWTVNADTAGLTHLRLQVVAGGVALTDEMLPIRFLPARPVTPTDHVPAPQPAPTEMLVGAHHCPLWEAVNPLVWQQVRKHPERIPALGFYAQESPEVADWETLWATEHGVDFFIYCWYRTSQGKPVEQMFGSAIHDGLFKSRHASAMRFTIMWENQRPGVSGIADEADLFTHLLPFWMENYFKHPSYLKVDNRPVLFIYRPEFLVKDLGSVASVVKAFEGMRQACRDEGFDGLTLLGEYRGLDRKHLQLMKDLGLDYTFAYCWYVPNNPSPQQAIEAQMSMIRQTEELGVLPQVVTVSQAWSGWNDEGSIWKIPPPEYKDLLQQGKAFVETLPKDTLSGRMLLLDNWNEWGEGHYIAPYTEAGFGYLDAVRDVFSQAPPEHTDLLPEDLGLGPYDAAYRTWVRRGEDLYRSLAAKVTKAGAAADGLVGWWAFDEDVGTPVALDYAGHRLGGRLIDARRAPGVDGNALVCDGGSVTVGSSSRLSITEQLTIECWVKTDVGGQGNTWMVNRVFGGGTDTGYRFGVLSGKPCFEIPQTSWSHHLSADVDLPLGRWVHVAGTFDGSWMRIYVDGVEHGTMERPGPINANDFKLSLGNFDDGHTAHFDGLLDEVRLYSRALLPAEIARHAAAVGPRN